MFVPKKMSAKIIIFQGKTSFDFISQQEESTYCKLHLKFVDNLFIMS